MRCLLTSGLPGTPARHSRPPRVVSSAFGVIYFIDGGMLKTV